MDRVQTSEGPTKMTMDKTRDELFAEYFEDREGNAQVAEHAYRQGWKDRVTYTVVPNAPHAGRRCATDGDLSIHCDT